MTVLVGIYCTDGVVIGADSSATFSAGQFPTVEQPVKKLSIVGTDLLTAGTGAVGLNQRFVNVLGGLRSQPNFQQSDRFAISKTISVASTSDFGQTGAQKGTFGALVAFATPDGNANLCEFDLASFQPEFRTDDLWFSSMGSGQPIADPFLGLLSRVFFGRKRPNLSEGIFATLWTLRHAIDLNAGGIQGPARLGVLRRQEPGGQWVASILSDDELQEHESNINAAEEHLASYRQVLSGGAAISDSSLTQAPAVPMPVLSPEK